MNTHLFLEILRLAVSLIEAQQTGNQNELDLEETLVELVQKGTQAYQQHTGEALDQSLIQFEPL